MSIIEKVKTDRLIARKAAKTGMVGYYNFIIGEIEKVGKNNGNRETTNDESITVVKKMLTNVISTIEAGGGNDAISAEKIYLESLLPPMATEEEVTSFIEGLVSDGGNKGSIMKDLRTKYGASVDMKMAGMVVDGRLK